MSADTATNKRENSNHLRPFASIRGWERPDVMKRKGLAAKNAESAERGRTHGLPTKHTNYTKGDGDCVELPQELSSSLSRRCPEVLRFFVSFVSFQATRKSPEPADWKACAASKACIQPNQPMMKKLKKIVENPWLNLFVAVILAATALSELWESLWEDLVNGNARGHHGILLYAVLSGLKAIPHLFEASEHASRD
jgi:hypothetical protein